MNIRPRLEPIRVVVGEELTTCVHCNARTEWYGELTDDGEVVEFCPPCGQNYIVEPSDA